MSTTLDTYLHYMANWADADDSSINDLIDEYHYFLLCTDFDSDGAVDDEFTTLVGLATTVRDATISANAAKIAGDAAAVAAVWSFGLSMAAFAVAQADAIISTRVASSKAKELNQKLGTVDTDISGKIGNTVDNYVRSYKANNAMLKAKYTTAVDGAHARAILLRFIATMVARGATLDPDTFRRYANSARVVLKDEASINRVYDALDTVNLDGKNVTDAELQELMASMANMMTMGAPDMAMSIVKGVVFPFLYYNIKVTNTRIKTFAKDAGVSVEELEVGTMDAMSSVGKFATAVGFMVSALDVMFSIWDIVDVVNQTKEMVDKLNNTVKQQYKDYFNGIKHAAKEYTIAIQEQGTTTTTTTSTTTTTTPAASASYTGSFFCTKYKNSVNLNDWHYVEITMYLSNKYKWTNRAGVSWTMTKDRDNAMEMSVGSDCPYYKYGYTVATYGANFDYVTGPWGEKYYRNTDGSAE